MGVEHIAPAPDGRTLTWTVNVDGASQLTARNLATGEDLATPALPLCEVLDLVVSPDGRSLVLVSTATRPTNLAVLDLASGAMRWVSDATPSTADPRTLVEPELVHFAAHDGRQLAALLYRPGNTTGPTPGGHRHPRRTRLPGTAYLLQRRALPVPGPLRGCGPRAQRARLHRVRPGVPTADPRENQNRARSAIADFLLAHLLPG